MKKRILLIIPLILLASCSLPGSSSNDIPSSETQISDNNSNVIENGEKKEFDYVKDNSKSFSNEVNGDEDIVVSKIDNLFERNNLKGMFDYVNNSDFGKNGKLEQPSNIVKTRKDISRNLDYANFYHIEQIDLTLSNEYIFEDIEKETNLAFWESDTLPGTVGLDKAYDLSNNKLSLKLIYNEEANSRWVSSKDSNTKQTAIPYTFYSKTGHRNLNFNDFGYLKDETKKKVDVYNSEQLVYVLENNYIPVPIENSPSEMVLNDAKELLNKIIYEDMDDVDKILAIMCWITSNACYDEITDTYITYYRDEEHFPDEMASYNSAIYVEGVLYNGYGVCHSFAKTFNLLANIEGIESHKITANYNDINPEETISPISKTSYNGINYSSTYVSHGYSYVKYNNKFYICDPTFNYAIHLNLSNTTYYVYRYLGVLLARNFWYGIYQSIDSDWFSTEYSDQLAIESIDWRDRFIMKVDDNSFNCKVYDSKSAEIVKNYFITYINNYSDDNYLSRSTCMFVPFWGNDEFRAISRSIVTDYSLLTAYNEPYYSYIYLKFY